MASRIRRALTFANVCSFLALTIAMGTGGAYAANTVFSIDIVDGEVKSADIAGAAVTNSKLGPNSVGSGKIIDGDVANADLANDSVNSANVVSESLTQSDLGYDSVNATEVADSAINSDEIENDSLLAGDLAGASVGSEELASNAVTGAKVAGNTLTTADIAGADVNGGGITVPAGSVPNGRCHQFDSAVAGATVGEAVVFSTKAALQDGVVIYGQRVPSNGHVTLSVCNFSGATQAAISDLPVRIITFG
jgi:hypothetical protein